jgi:hypothetical protein
LKPRFEHQGRYFKEIGYTLFGIVVEVNVEDMRDDFFDDVIDGICGAKLKEAMIEMYDAEHLPHVCTFTVIIISSDLTHDPAAVQHFNDKILTPFMKENISPDLERWEIHLVDSDGAPTQFDLADQYLWISYQLAKHGIRMDWTLNCSCHGKNKVDPENGGAKNMVLAAMLTESDIEQSKRIESAKAAADFMSENYSKPYVDILSKKCVGIFKRVVFFVPSSGLGSIDRNIKKCKTLKGSKPYRQFTDVGVPGVVDIRLASCHECIGCRGLCARAACANMDMCGPVERVALEPEAVSERRLTRHALQERGVSLCEEIEEGSLVAVELTNESEVFMLGVIVPGPDGEEGVYRVLENSQSYMGRLEPGDQVIQVQKFEPTQVGSNLFRLTEKEFPVFIEDVRLIIEDVDFQSDGESLRRAPTRVARGAAAVPRKTIGRFDPLQTYRLSASGKEEILKLIPEF